MVVGNETDELIAWVELANEKGEESAYTGVTAWHPTTVFHRHGPHPNHKTPQCVAYQQIKDTKNEVVVGDNEYVMWGSVLPFLSPTLCFPQLKL